MNSLAIDVEELALGNEDGVAELYLSATSDASNSLVEGFKQNTGAVEVTTRRLDTYLAAKPFGPTVIKIDAETFEPQVLQGARETLRRHRPTVVVEVLHRDGRDHGPDVMGAVDGLGYGYYDIRDGSAWTPSDRITGDAGGGERDWLLCPAELPPAFARCVASWRRAVSDT